MKYQGHKNWNYWNVSLWINNDEGLYRLAQQCIRDTKNRKDAALLFVDSVTGDDAFSTDKTPDGAPYTKTAVQLAMVGMDYAHRRT